MENIINNIPVAISIILPMVLVLMVVTNIITEVLVAMVVTLLAFFALCQIMGISITWYMVAGAVILGIFVAYAAMFGFDKLRQTMEQLKNIQNK